MVPHFVFTWWLCEKSFGKQNSRNGLLSRASCEPTESSSASVGAQQGIALAMWHCGIEQLIPPKKNESKALAWSSIERYTPIFGGRMYLWTSYRIDVPLQSLKISFYFRWFFLCVENEVLSQCLLLSPSQLYGSWVQVRGFNGIFWWLAVLLNSLNIRTL